MLCLFTLFFLLVLPVSASATPPAKTLPETNPKYLVVRTVFDRMARVVGRVPPQLYLLKADDWDKPIRISLGVDPLSRVRVDEQGKFVVMDETLVDLTTKFGSPRERDNALAFLIGHELAHYASRQSGGLAGNEKNPGDRKKAEELADRMGSWYASEAGYEPFPAAEQALRAVYDHYYDGKPDLKEYPLLTERIAIINRVRDELADKLPFLDAAATLLAIGRPYEAARLYEHIARDYKSLETLDNAAVANALAALAIPPRSPYFYPFELETAYRFRTNSKGIEVDQEADRQTLLSKAANLLDQSLYLDKILAATHLNRAAVAELQGDTDTMWYHLGQAEKLAGFSTDQQTLARIAILKGIALAKSGKSAEAAAAFTEARPQAEQMAVTNLLAMGEDPKLPSPPFIPEDPVAENISGAMPSRQGDILKITASKPILLNDEYGGNVTIYQVTNAKWKGAQLQLGGLTVSTIATPESYAAACKRGVRIGDNEGAVTGRYGRPNRIIATRQGSLLVYSQDSVIFTIDREHKVKAWTIYSVEEQ